ncbi:MAG: component of SufBCD complex [Pseudomonadota bacterium]
MDVYTEIFELIDMRSFSNLWFWIMLAVMWSSTSHWVLGVPWDMVTRAQRSQDAQKLQDVTTLTHINARRIADIADETGLLMAGFGCFILTMLMLLGFVYEHEFSQALFLLGFPMSLVGLICIASSRRILAEAMQGDDLFRMMRRHRTLTQVVGMVSIFVTGLWGMMQNFNFSALN